MSLLQANQPTAIHQAIAWAILLGGAAWGLAQCSSSSSTSARTEVAAQPSGGLEKIKILSTHYRVDGFGTVFVASFAIHNDNDYPIKDVELTCHHAAQSGTYIDKNVRTVYERVSARGYTYVRDFNMGFVTTQAVKTACVPTGYERV